MIQSRLRQLIAQYLCPAAIISLNRMLTTNAGRVDHCLITTPPVAISYK